MSRLAENISRVKARIEAAGKDPESVTLIAVSKTRNAAEIRAAFDCGIKHFGENYLQEALPKMAELEDLPLTWHFIGPVQSNKTRDIACHFDWVQSLDRLKIARRLSEQREVGQPPLQLCLQVNMDDESSKAGVAPDEIMPLARAVLDLPHLQLRGLMAIPAPRTDYAEQLATCRRVVGLFTEVRNHFADIDTLSLGMSADLEAAVAAGSNMVRIGTDIFGPRD